ncbi:hypothetical protein SAMN05444283_1539 [Bacteroides stercoris]|nr:hypothetical protein SAMN05444283_1539 [Bacteroides stercoris]
MFILNNSFLLHDNEVHMKKEDTLLSKISTIMTF